MNIRAQRQGIIDQYISLYGYTQEKRQAAALISLVDISQGVEISPFTKLTITEAQALIDSLWECGLRPSEGSGSAGAMRAAENNLIDLRGVVNGLFRLLEKGKD